MTEGEMILEFQEIVKEHMELRERIKKFEKSQTKIRICGFPNYIQLASGIRLVAGIENVQYVNPNIHITGTEPLTGFTIVQVEKVR